jgi:hypothetical protein
MRSEVIAETLVFAGFAFNAVCSQCKMLLALSKISLFNNERGFLITSEFGSSLILEPCVYINSAIKFFKKNQGLAKELAYKRSGIPG